MAVEESKLIQYFPDGLEDMDSDSLYEAVNGITDEGEGWNVEQLDIIGELFAQDNVGVQIVGLNLLAAVSEDHQSLFQILGEDSFYQYEGYFESYIDGIQRLLVSNELKENGLIDPTTLYGMVTSIGVMLAEVGKQENVMQFLEYARFDLDGIYSNSELSLQTLASLYISKYEILKKLGMGKELSKDVLEDQSIVNLLGRIRVGTDFFSLLLGHTDSFDTDVEQDEYSVLTIDLIRRLMISCGKNRNLEIALGKAFSEYQESDDNRVQSKRALQFLNCWMKIYPNHRISAKPRYGFPSILQIGFQSKE